MAKSGGTNPSGYGRMAARESRERGRKKSERKRKIRFLKAQRWLGRPPLYEDAIRPFPIQQLIDFLRRSNHSANVNLIAAISEGHASEHGWVYERRLSQSIEAMLVPATTAIGTRLGLSIAFEQIEATTITLTAAIGDPTYQNTTG